MSRRWTRLLVAFTAAAALLVAAPVFPASAQSNFTESDACGTAGYRGPLAATGGWLPLGTPVYGPWADFYGRNGYAVEDHLVSWRPFRSSRTVRVHELALPAFELVNENLAAEYARGNYYPVSVAYGYAFRAVTGGSHRMSFHAFGTAVDINPAQNPYSDADPPVLITNMPDWYVRAWQDAGFCWGGDWNSIKDTMHFSWMGPAYTPGYPVSPAPQPATTPRSGFRTVGFAGSVGIADEGWEFEVIDRSRDGAPDVYAWRWMGAGEIRLEIASAFGDFDDIGIRENISVVGGPETHGVTFADFDGDSRADLWVVDWATGRITIYGDTAGEADRFTVVIAERTLGVDGGVVLLAGDYNGDRVPEAYVIDTDGVVAVLNGADGFATTLAGGATGARPRWNRFDLGDYDGNGAQDLFAISAVSNQVYVANGFGTGFDQGPFWQSLVPTAGLARVADFDGDGRQDVYHLAGNALTVYLGGVRSGSDDLQAWYEYEELDPWDAGPECIGPLPCDKIGYVTRDLEYNLRDNLSWEGGRYAEFFFGAPGDRSLLGDWDGNGVSTPGMFRPSNGFAYIANKNATQVASQEFYFGIGGDLPLAGDWDGDGADTLSIYRPSTGRFYVSNELRTKFADFDFPFVLAGGVPFAGDFNGDGRDDLGLFRPSDGYVVMRFMGSSAGPPDAAFYVGSEADTVVAGDWSGDGTDTVAWLDDAAGRWYFRLSNGPGAPDHVLRAGPRSGEVIPIVGTWTVLGR